MRRVAAVVQVLHVGEARPASAAWADESGIGIWFAVPYPSGKLTISGQKPSAIVKLFDDIGVGFPKDDVPKGATSSGIDDVAEGVGVGVLTRFGSQRCACPNRARRWR